MVQSSCFVYAMVAVMTILYADTLLRVFIVALDAHVWYSEMCWLDLIL